MRCGSRKPSNCWREEFCQSRRLPMMSVTRTRASSVACSTERLASRQHNIGGDLVNCAVSCHSLCPTNKCLSSDPERPQRSGGKKVRPPGECTMCQRVLHGHPLTDKPEKWPASAQ